MMETILANDLQTTLRFIERQLAEGKIVLAARGETPGLLPFLIEQLQEVEFDKENLAVVAENDGQLCVLTKRGMQASEVEVLTSLWNAMSSKPGQPIITHSMGM
ncbi:MAG: hypothetical protein KDJ45_01335 [Hyphomicrobiaceae bacterium]|nr:hypothetical protein [Hyphomicrobiaceae bacterium]MCC0009781.1 hypothetical protein [Hyphomicrobiaceae bacterium]